VTFRLALIALLAPIAAAPLPAAAQSVALAEVAARAETPGIEAARRLVATLQLAAQEYRLAWQSGALTQPSEWEEAKLFVAEARRSANELPPELRARFGSRVAALERRLAARMSPDSLAQEAADIERQLTVAFGESLDERPAREPSVANGELLFRSTCTRCHGLQGRGDGPVARAHQLNPPPADLTDSVLLAGTTPLDLYRKISFGVPGTRMQQFGDALSREERWDLVAYVLTLSDSAARRGRNGQLAVVFGTVRGTLGGAMELAEHGNAEASARRVFDAYLAYETIEGSLRPVDPGLVRRAEARFAALREAAAAGTPKAERGLRYAEVLASLAESEAALTRTRSATGLFAESFLLILREGFEAILVIGAIMAVLVKAGARAKQRSVRLGIAAAIAASLVTAALLEQLFRATPAQREALEGGIMLLAAAVLFYVSYWLISKIEIVAWTRFVKGQIQKAAESGSALALAGVAFVAVYREGFETVLFYKALYVSGAGGAGPITAGLIAGLAVLVAVYVGIEAFGLKLPMRPFFAVTGATLAFLAFVFAGDGVKELQEGGYVASSLVSHGPRNEFLGIYPTWESLGVQALILAAILGALAFTFVIRPWRARAAKPEAPHAMRNVLLLVIAVAGLAASSARAQQPAPRAARTARSALPALLTRPERTAYRETSRYDDVMALLREVTRGRPRMHLTEMGYTGETRAIPLVIVGGIGDTSAEAVRRSGKVRIYIQANIHAGEVEGKEAAQILLRDLAAGRHARWLDSLILLVAPIYNADGNERVALTNRQGQLGPVGGEGQRANAAGLDLNRDHMKLESPEARSQVLLLRRYDPDVAIDLHTTDGSVHGYLLTYAEPLHPATDTGIVGLLRGNWLPEVTRRIKASDGWDFFFYGNFPESPVDRGGGSADRGWYSFDYRPRFSENYWGIRNRVGILSEAYSYATLEDSIAAPLGFLEKRVEFAYRNAGRIRRLVEAADAHSVVGESLAVRARLHKGSDIDVAMGQVTEERNPFTGQRMLHRVDVHRTERMPDYTTFEGAEYARAPRAYFIPAGLDSVIGERLEAHGVVTTRLAQPLAIAVERFRIDSTWIRLNAFQNHRERTVTGAWEASTDTLAAGTVVVRVDQPLGRLVFLLLEPRSDDGLLDWNFLDGELSGARYYPVRRTFYPFCAPWARCARSISHAPAATTSTENPCASVNAPRMRSSLARKISTNIRAMPARARYTPARQPAPMRLSRSRTSSANAASAIATS
jgi:FTR1 family protein